MIKSLVYMFLLVTMAINPVLARQTEKLIPVNTDLQMCQTDAVGYLKVMSKDLPMSRIQSDSGVSFEYLNTVVKSDYIKMTDAVSRYVAVKVALSLFSFNSNSLNAENITAHISTGTKPFLPFSFANGVKIIDANAKGKIIVYKTKMPITKAHQQATQLALAGRISTVAYVCNNAAMVEDLLERHIVIQYDYYDANGDFLSSFTINGHQEV